MDSKRVKVWVAHFADRPTLQLQWFDPATGRRKTRSSRTRCPRAAEAARVDLEADLNAGRYSEPARLPWQGFVKLLERDHLPGVRPSTRTNYRMALAHFGRLVAPGTLRAVTQRSVARYATALREEGKEPSTIRVYLAFLHAALSWGVPDLLPAVPPFPEIRVPRKTPEPVAPELAERLLEAADRQERAFLLCGWLAGLRRNEALELEWQRGGAVPWLDPHRTPHPRIWLPAEAVKGAEDQWVALHPELWAALDALPRRGPKVFRFTGARGPLTPSGVSQLITGLARRAGVRLSMKSLRRGFACRLAARVPAQTLKKVMRHADVRTTLEFYANVDQAAEEAVLGSGQDHATPAR